MSEWREKAEKFGEGRCMRLSMSDRTSQRRDTTTDHALPHPLCLCCSTEYGLQYRVWFGCGLLGSVSVWVVVVVVAVAVAVAIV